MKHVEARKVWASLKAELEEAAYHLLHCKISIAICCVSFP